MKLGDNKVCGNVKLLKLAVCNVQWKAFVVTVTTHPVS
jgi:hypothetical protein